MGCSEAMLEISSQPPFRASGLGADPVAPAGQRQPALEEDRPSRGTSRDSVTISAEALALAEQDDEAEVPSSGAAELESESTEGDDGPQTPGELTPEEQEVVAELSARDREVRAHEQAHATVGGHLAGSPSYEFESGPDGKRYAVAGEVPIELREGRDPEETLRNAQIVRRAALAPAEPSPQDRSVAAAASQMEARARAEILEERAAETQESNNPEESPGRTGGANEPGESAQTPESDAAADGSPPTPEELENFQALGELEQAASVYRQTSLGEDLLGIFSASA